MSEIDDGSEEKRTYYVHGSGLVPVPGASVNEIPEVISEYHLEEARRARLLSLVSTRRG